MPVELTGKPHPLRSDLHVCELEAGASLASVIPFEDGLVAQVNGELWGISRWDDPLPDGHVAVYRVTRGDDVWRAVAMVTVAVAAAVTGQWYAYSYLGLTGAAGLAVQVGVGAAVTIAGSALVNKLIPPVMPKTDTGSTGGGKVADKITGTSNRANPYGVIPRIYGKVAYYPSLAGNPVPEIVGNDQYLRMLFCLGYGDLAFENSAGAQTITDHNSKIVAELADDVLTIGDTSLNDYTDVEYEIGYPDRITLYGGDFDTQSVNMPFKGRPAEPWSVHHYPAWGFPSHTDYYRYDDGLAITRTTPVNTKEFTINLAAMNGLWAMGQRTDPVGVKVTFKIEWKLSNQDWNAAQSQDYVVSAYSKNTIRRAIRIKTDPGQYDVRLTRVMTEWHAHKTHGAAAMVSDFVWTSLVCMQPGEAYKGDHLLLALRIKATDQFNGVIDTLQVRCQSVLPVWDGSAFTVKPTSNPGWEYLNALRGQQVARPVSLNRINLDSLLDFAGWCDSQGLEYNYVHDGAETLFERLRSIAAAGEGTFALQDGEFGVIRDDPEAPLVQMISPRNSWGGESQRVYKDLPHAVRVKYVDAETWQDAERIVYRDGYDENTATIFEDFQTQGITSADQAYHQGTYHIRQAQLRPETFTRTMDWENLVCRRGDRVRLQDDVLRIGLGAARITEVITDGQGEATAVRIDADYNAATGMRIRRQDGSQALTSFTENEGLLTFLNGGVADVNVGDLVLLGHYDTESIDCKIIKIEPANDFEATLTLVDAATNIYDFGAAPPYDPGITKTHKTLTAPGDVTIRSDVEDYVVAANGAVESRAYVSWTAVNNATSYELLYRRTDSDDWTTINTSLTTTPIQPVYDGQTLTVKVRAHSIVDNLTGPWASATATIDAYVKLGEDTRLPVPDVTGLELFQQANDTTFGGREAKFAWRKTSETDWHDLGWEPQGASSGAMDLYFKDYQVEIWALVNNQATLVRTEWVADPQYLYSYEKNAEDYMRTHGGAVGSWRAFECRVYCRGRQNQVSLQAARLVVENPAPGLPDTITITPSLRSIQIEFQAPADLDYKHTRVWLSTAQGFTPSDDTLAAQVDGSVAIQGLADSTEYYIRMASYDAFGQGLMSPEFHVQTVTLDTGDIAGLDDAISDLQNDVDGKGDILFQSTEPGTAYQNDHTLWVDTSLDAGDNPINLPHKWDGSAWVAISDQTLQDAADDAYKAAQQAQQTADSKVKTFVAGTAPTAETIGDLWFDSNNNNHPYQWDGSQWQSVRDGTIAAASTSAADAMAQANTALTAAQAAQATADNAIRTYYQSDAPTGLNNTDDVGDLWFDTDNDQAYRWSGTQWNLIQDNAIATALAAAQNAQTTADGKIVSFYQPSAPAAGSTGDLWFDSDDDNKPYYWDGTNWIAVRDQKIDSKTRVFRATSAPTATAVGDLWFDTDDGNKPYYWTGTAWAPVQDGGIQDAKDLAEGKSVVLVQSTTPASQYENDKTLWIDTTNGANTQKHWDGSAWVIIRDKAIQDAQTDISDLQDKKTIRMDANGIVVGTTTLDGQPGGQLNVSSTDFNIVDASNPTVLLRPFEVQGNTVYANNLIVNHSNYEDGSILLSGPAITGQLGGDNIADGAIVNITEYTAAPGTQIFDGTDNDTWKQACSTDVTVLGDNSALAIQFFFSFDVDQVSDTWSQAGPGGPTVELRLRRKTGPSTYVTVWNPDPVMASGSGRISLQFTAKIDTSMLAGVQTYVVELKWSKGVYDAGTVDYHVRWTSDGKAYLDISNFIVWNGAFPTTYIGEGWELAFPGTGLSGVPVVSVPAFQVNNTQVVTQGWYTSNLYLPPIQKDFLGNPTPVGMPGLDDPNKANASETHTSQPYIATCDSHRLIGRLHHYFIHAVEYR